jgi:hypothetical protein
MHVPFPQVLGFSLHSSLSTQESLDVVREKPEEQEQEKLPALFLQTPLRHTEP